ncbi:MAG: cold-shock protein [Gammaproteobacteria bacterium]|jgi:CspA family cold shock protein
MKSGKVKFFNEEKGYGFVGPDDGGKDAFVHHTCLKECGIRTLKENDVVEFETQTRDGKERITKIQFKN